MFVTLDNTQSQLTNFRPSMNHAVDSLYSKTVGTQKTMNTEIRFLIELLVNIHNGSFKN